MKQTILLFILICYYIGCSIATHKLATETPVKQIPHWYNIQNIISKKFEIIGYGDGSSFEEARVNARSEIAKQIRVMVKSNFLINEKYASNNTKEGYDLHIFNEISEQTNIELDDIYQLKSEMINGHVYVAMKYINLPIHKKIKYMLKLKNDYKCNMKNNSRFLSQTPLMKKLKKILSYEPALEVLYKNNNWYISIEQILIRIPSYEYTDLWAGCNDNNIKIKSSKALLKKDDVFHLNVYIYQDGYVSLFNVYQTGQTVSLLVNMKTKKDTILLYPDNTKYDGLVADISKDEAVSKDLYISILCPDKKDLSRYEPIDDIYLASNNSYNFGHLIEDIKGCNVSTCIVHTRQQLNYNNIR